MQHICNEEIVRASFSCTALYKNTRWQIVSYLSFTHCPQAAFRRSAPRIDGQRDEVASFSGVPCSCVVYRSLVLTSAQMGPRSWSGDALTVSSELRFRYFYYSLSALVRLKPQCLFQHKCDFHICVVTPVWWVYNMPRLESVSESDLFIAFSVLLWCFSVKTEIMIILMLLNIMLLCVCSYIQVFVIFKCISSQNV